jgi:hypothetical protein
VNSPGQWRILTLLRQIGGGYLLSLAILPLFYVKIGFGPSHWDLPLEFVSQLVIVLWMGIGQCHMRLAAGAMHLRAPGVLRMLCWSLAGAAAWTILCQLVPVGLWHGPLLLWFAAIVYSMCAGLLVSLFGGTRWQLPLTFSCVGIPLCIGIPWLGQSFVRQSLGPLAAVMPLLIAWRLRVLINALHSGSQSNALRWLVSGSWNAWAAWSANPGAADTSGGKTSHWRLDGPPSIDAFRIVFGPPLKLDALFKLLILAAVPSVFLLLDRHHAGAGKMFLGGQSWILPMMAVTFCVARVRRLGEFLWNQNREISDLALLPGLGNRRMQRRALMRESLERPLIIYSLSFGGLILCWLLVARAVDASLQPILFLGVAAFSVLVLFTMMSTGVLCGAIGRSSPWFKGLAYFVVIPPWFSALLPAAIRALPWACVRGSAVNLVIWQSAFYAAALAAMSAPLVAWAVRLKRRPNLLCR